jgi:hypothetical protein
MPDDSGGRSLDQLPGAQIFRENFVDHIGERSIIGLRELLQRGLHVAIKANANQVLNWTFGENPTRPGHIAPRGIACNQLPFDPPRLGLVIRPQVHADIISSAGLFHVLAPKRGPATTVM